MHEGSPARQAGGCGIDHGLRDGDDAMRQHSLKRSGQGTLGAIGEVAKLEGKDSIIRKTQARPRCLRSNDGAREGRTRRVKVKGRQATGSSIPSRIIDTISVAPTTDRRALGREL